LCSVKVDTPFRSQHIKQKNGRQYGERNIWIDHSSGGDRGRTGEQGHHLEEMASRVRLSPSPVSQSSRCVNFTMAKDRETDTLSLHRPHWLPYNCFRVRTFHFCIEVSSQSNSGIASTILCCSPSSTDYHRHSNRPMG